MPKDLVKAMRIRGILSHDGMKITIKRYHGRLASVCPDMSFISSSNTINPTLSYSLEGFVLLISSQLPPPHAEALEAAYGILTVVPSHTLS